MENVGDVGRQLSDRRQRYRGRDPLNVVAHQLFCKCEFLVFAPSKVHFVIYTVATGYDTYEILLIKAQNSY